MSRKSDHLTRRGMLTGLLALSAPRIGNAQDDAKLLDGGATAAEFPDGLAWLNTAAPIKLRDLHGKFVLLDFWTFCCINCMHVIPELKKLEEKYSQELVVIGVHSAKFRNEKETGQIREAVIRYGVQHPVVNDADFRVWNSFGARAWPTFVLINPNGKVIGSMSGEEVFEPMDRVLTAGVPYFLDKKELIRSPLKTTLEEAARPETLLSYPGKISADPQGRRLFITDSNHNRILITNVDGHILDVIGSGAQGSREGQFAEAEFHHPQGTFLDKDILYIADTENHLLRTANLKTRQVQTVLGTGAQSRRRNVPGIGREVGLNSPWDVVIHEGTAYIAMAGSHQIWSADLTTWQVQPFAGSARENITDGKRLDAALAQTSGLAIQGRDLYFADSETSSVRKVGLTADGAVTTIVGKGLFDFGDQDGDCAGARLQHPLGVAAKDGIIYVADTYNSKIKAIDPAKCSTETFAGNGAKTLRNGGLKTASLNEPGGLVWLGGKLYVADTNNHVIRVIDPKAKTVATLELTGIEKLTDSRRSEFRGRSVQLGEVQIQPGRTQLAITFVLPDGYKLNGDAPFYLNWAAADANLQFANKPEDVDLKNLKFPVNVRISSLKQKTAMTIDAIVYYCTSEESACLVDRIRISLDVRPLERGPVSAPIRVEVRKPATV